MLFEFEVFHSTYSIAARPVHIQITQSS